MSLNDRVASYLSRARELAAGGRYDDAGGFERLAKQMADALTGDSRQEDVAIDRAVAARLRMQGRHAEAARRLKEAVLVADALPGIEPRERFLLHHELGTALLDAGDDLGAITVLEKAVGEAAPFGPAFAPAIRTRLALATALRRGPRAAEADQHLVAARDALAAGRPEGWEKSVAEIDALRTQPAPPAPAPVAAPVIAAPPPPLPPAHFDQAAYDRALADLDELIGLAAVKDQVHRLAELLRIAQLRKDAGLRTANVSLHLVFVGGPGTGKTTVARLFGRLYHSLGLLATDKVSEVTRADLVSGYIGQTAKLTNQVIDTALDGVLFLDEAYALAKPDSHGDFGAEAITELLKRMEDDRGRLAVIAAGYPDEMRDFLQSNSGLASRFGETVQFADYTPAEMAEIFGSFCAQNDYAVADAAQEALLGVLTELYAGRDRYFANGRTVRNLFDDAVARQAQRLLKAGPSPTREQLIRIEAADLTG